MIPIRDSTPNRRLPLVNWSLIALCALAFYSEITAGPGLDELLHTYGLIPARFVALGQRSGWIDGAVWLPVWSSAFLHAPGVMHFGGNMLFLWIFGDNVEDRFGHVGYLGFYLLGAMIAALVQVASDPGSTTVVIGASGAVAAVMGAYLVLYPRAWITSFVFPLFWLQFELPALIYLLFWFVLQVWLGISPDTSMGVAWWAHIGGFVFGMAAIAVLGREAPQRAEP